MYMWRCKSAWNSHLLMRRYLSLLASSLGSVLKERYVILGRGSVSLASNYPGPRQAVTAVLHPCFETAELQPCDTHLFARFKDLSGTLAPTESAFHCRVAEYAPVA